MLASSVFVNGGTAKHSACTDSIKESMDKILYFNRISCFFECNPRRYLNNYSFYGLPKKPEEDSALALDMAFSAPHKFVFLAQPVIF